MDSSRRDLLKLALGMGAWLAGCRSKPKNEVPQQAPRRPNRARYWISILLSGGHDSVYTTDPKQASEVDSAVTLPTDNTIAQADGLALGPHFAPLARWASSFTILNGVQVRTVNHETGQKQFLHWKTNITDAMPSALDVIGLHRDGQPLNTAYLSLSTRLLHSPAYFGTADRFYFGKGDVFERIARERPDDLATLAKVLRREADTLRRRRGWHEAEETARYYGDVAAFLERAAHVTPLVPEQRSTDYVAQAMAESMERALWLIENDLCSGVMIDAGVLSWDTHLRNEAKQTEMNGLFARFFDEMLGELRARKNQHGVLADRTAVLVGSELGRFPKQNDMLGKDHMPQASLLMSMPGLKKGAFGKTGRMMEGLPLSYQTGQVAQAGRVPVLDDVGATLMHVAGIDAERYGYHGEVCKFMVDEAA